MLGSARAPPAARGIMERQNFRYFRLGNGALNYGEAEFQMFKIWERSIKLWRGRISDISAPSLQVWILSAEGVGASPRCDPHGRRFSFKNDGFGLKAAAETFGVKLAGPPGSEFWKIFGLLPFFLLPTVSTCSRWNHSNPKEGSAHPHPFHPQTPQMFFRSLLTQIHHFKREKLLFEVRIAARGNSYPFSQRIQTGRDGAEISELLPLHNLTPFPGLKHLKILPLHNFNVPSQACSGHVMVYKRCR